MMGESKQIDGEKQQQGTQCRSVDFSAHEAAAGLTLYSSAKVF